MSRKASGVACSSRWMSRFRLKRKGTSGIPSCGWASNATHQALFSARKPATFVLSHAFIPGNAKRESFTPQQITPRSTKCRKNSVDIAKSPLCGNDSRSTAARSTPDPCASGHRNRQQEPLNRFCLHPGPLLAERVAPPPNGDSPGQAPCEKRKTKFPRLERHLHWRKIRGATGCDNVFHCKWICRGIGGNMQAKLPCSANDCMVFNFPY